MISSNFSKTAIDKLGVRIRTNGGFKEACCQNDLQLLQDYRLSHKNSLKEVFNVLSMYSKSLQKGRLRIVSFRVKKIETIISKLKRLPKMRLVQMGDIAGCRCVLQNDKMVYELKNTLCKHFNVEEKKVNDRIKNPSEDGYKAIHLYVKPKNVNNPKIIEIQIRTLEQHNWSTFVEIIDVMYGIKIKEGDKSKPKLNKFLKLYSEVSSAELKDKLELIEIEKEHKIYSEMLEIFSPNLIKLREIWMNMEGYSTRDSFLIFEVNKSTKVSNVKVYQSFEEAENVYFSNFTNSETDILVTQLDVNNFNQLSIAYANYFLTNHSFQDTWHNLLNELIRELYEKKEYNKLKMVYKLYKYIVEEEHALFEKELMFIDKEYQPETSNISKVLKINKWITEQTQAHEDRMEEFKTLEKYIDIDELDAISVFFSSIWNKTIGKWIF